MKPNQIPRNSSCGWRCCPAVAALLASLASPACAQDQGLARKFYFTANLGASMPGDTTVKSSDLPIESGPIKFGPGMRLDVGFGYYITDRLSAELDTGILISPVHGDDDAAAGNFTYNQIPILANLIYHIPTRSRFRPFFGAGFGGVESQLVDYDFLSSGGSGSDFGLAWQALAGCRYQLSSRVDLGVAYKYLGTTDRTFDSLSLRMSGTHTHSLTASVLLKF